MTHNPIAPPGDDPSTILAAAHYPARNGIRIRDVIRDWGLGYELGTALACLLTHNLRGQPLRDLETARQFLRFVRDDLHGNPDHSLLEWDGVRGPARYRVPDVAAAFAVPPYAVIALEVIHRVADVVTLAVPLLDTAIDAVGKEIARLEAAALPQAGRAA